MKIFLHNDKEKPSKPWYDKFREISARYCIPVVEVNLAHPETLEFLRQNATQHDLFIGRIRHSPELLNVIKPIYKEVCSLFGACFPDKKSFYYYDDKYKQVQFLTENKYPTPKAEYDTVKTLKFPVVCKKSNGASSENVWLARRQEEVNPPCLIQEYFPNSGDVRINVIGHRVMGFLRENRPNDFRASGSGLLTYANELPKECVEIAYKISSENGFRSMAYDFIQDKQGKWYVIEFSYTYRNDCVAQTQYYYDMKTGQKIDKTGIYPEEFIFEDILPKIYT